jgi:hypothetical protein
VKVNRCALGERIEPCVLYRRPGQPSGDATRFPASDAGLAAQACEAITLDHYFAVERLSRCDAIKCDIEGAELSFLRGATRVLEEHQPLIMIELNPASLGRARSTAREVLEYVSGHGDYRFVRIEASTGRLLAIDPPDCDGLRDYTNVLCMPGGSPALARLPVVPRKA